MNVEEIATTAIDCGLYVHRRLGPGLLESAYEAVLADSIEKRGLAVERQKLIPITVDGLFIENGFRADLIIGGQLLIELKSVERLAPVHGKQVQTYLKFMDLRVGLLMNLGAETFREGLRRIVNGHDDRAATNLRINQPR